MIKKVFLNYLHVALLKESPENTFYSPFLMILSFCWFTIIMVIQWSFNEDTFTSDMLVKIVMAGSLASSFLIYSLIILLLRGLESRLVQTVSCLLFSQVIIHFLALPLIIADPFLVQVNLKNPIFLFLGVVYLFLSLGLSVWQFVISAHIYKYALNITPIQSVLAAFGLVAVNILTLSFWR
ncbi:MAG: hypothetical protein PSV35_10005 [bacterium]|nr:hypothetical protein [bacterium]